MEFRHYKKLLLGKTMRVKTKASETLNAQKTIRLNREMLKIANQKAKKSKMTTNEWIRTAIWEKIQNEDS